jgi:peptide/nickel transport system permease protein
MSTMSRNAPTSLLLGTGERPARKSSGLFNRVARQTGWPILLVAAGLLLIAIFANVLSPHDPLAGSLRDRLVPPLTTSEFPLGTDPLGRDMLSRLMYGARISLLVGFSAVTLGMVVGSLLGLIAGYVGGWPDAVLMRAADAQLSLPSFILALTIMAALGSGLFNVILALSIGSWVRYARVVRSMVLPLRETEYVLAAQTIGCAPNRVMRRHVMPNVVTPVIILATLGLGTTIIAESSLSFLGLGVDPESPSWGSMLSEGRAYLDSAWWVAAFPGIAITITVLCVNLIGDALRDQLDPQTMRR